MFLLPITCTEKPILIKIITSFSQYTSQDIYQAQQAQGTQGNPNAGAQGNPNAGQQGGNGASQPEDVEFEEVK